MKTFELRLIPYDLHAAIKAAAFREGVSMNKWILQAVRNEVKRSTKTMDKINHWCRKCGAIIECAGTQYEDGCNCPVNFTCENCKTPEPSSHERGK